MYKRLSSLTKHTAHLTTIIFLAGFLFDAFLLPDIEDPIARYVGFGYLFLIGLLIMFREWVVSRNTASEFEQKVYSFATFGISYFSGSALSFVFIFAIRSAQLSVSWPLFLILLLCIFANEFVSTHDFRFALDIGVLLTALLFFVIFNAPLWLKVQNDTTFALAVGITVLISVTYIYLLKFSSENALFQAPRGYALAVGIPMFVAMLYFLNVMPAVPLSLKDAGVYHNVIRNGEGDFIAQKERDDRKWAKYRTPIYHLMPVDDGVFFFSAVNAPAELTAPISYVWEYYDNEKKKWFTSGVPISFTLEGGREDGYRAYSQKQNITEGLWRVTVKVGNKRVIGRVKFLVTREGVPEVNEVKL